jgi:chromosomal replication initiator protein
MKEGVDPTRELWQSVLEGLRSDDRITPQLEGFLSLVEPKGVMAGTLYLEVPNDLTRGMLEQRIRLPLLNAISALSEDQSVSSFAIVVNPDIAHDYLEQTGEPVEQPYIEQQVTISPVDSGKRSDSRLNAKYSFDNFVIGGSNRFAHAAAVAVAEAPAKAYNPLFIYGESGLGKTHLLHAIGHYAESLYPGIRIRYVSWRSSRTTSSTRSRTTGLRCSSRATARSTSSSSTTSSSCRGRTRPRRRSSTPSTPSTTTTSRW